MPSLPLLLRLPPLYWMASLGIGLALHYGFGRPFLLPLPGPKIVTLILFALAGVVALWALISFRRAKTPWHPYETPRALVARGPYRFTRNPMYLGLLLLQLGIAYWTRGLLIFTAPLLFFAAMNFVQIPYEEKVMSALFSEQYEDYRRRVRRWL